MSTENGPVYAARGSSNVIYIGYPWSYVQRCTSGVPGLTVKRFKTVTEPFSSGWYKGVDPNHVKIKASGERADTVKSASCGKKAAISSPEQRSSSSISFSIPHSTTQPVKKDIRSACPDVFYGKSVANLADMAEALAPDTSFKFLDESTSNPSKDYLACYTEARMHMEASLRARANTNASASPAIKTDTDGIPDYVAFTDGGSTPSAGGPGGWGCVLFSATEMHVYARSYKATTNNRMELRGILCALLNVPEGSTLHIYSDSQYAINCCNTWLDQWRKKGLLCPKNPTREAIKCATPLNKDLLLWIYAAMQSRTVRFIHVRGHSGNRLNDFVDNLCHLGRKGLVPEYDDTY